MPKIHVKTESSKATTSSPKKLNEKIKKQILYYIENELPDKQLETELKPLKNSIKTQVKLHLYN